MSLIKRLIRLPFNMLGFQIVTMDRYNLQQQKINEIMNKAQTYYKESLVCRVDSLTDPEYLQFLELKYGGWVSNVNPTITGKDVGHDIPKSHSGGDKFNVFRIGNNYSEIYSKYLDPMRNYNKKITIVEIGILRGTSLAIWDEYFNNKIIYGFDFDLGNFNENIDNLIELGAFKDGTPHLVKYDQLNNNKSELSEIFGTSKIDIVIDDALHSDKAIINSFNEFNQYLSESFLYFIEDNNTAWKKLKKMYPQYKYNYNGERLTVVSNQ